MLDRYLLNEYKFEIPQDIKRSCPTVFISQALRGKSDLEVEIGNHQLLTGTEAGAG